MADLFVSIRLCLRVVILLLRRRRRTLRQSKDEINVPIALGAFRDKGS